MALTKPRCLCNIVAWSCLVDFALPVQRLNNVLLETLSVQCLGLIELTSSPPNLPPLPALWFGRRWKRGGGYIIALERMNYNHIVRSMSGDTDFFLFFYLFCNSLLQGLRGVAGIVKCVLSRSLDAQFRLPSDKYKPIFCRITFV